MTSKTKSKPKPLTRDQYFVETLYKFTGELAHLFPEDKAKQDAYARLNSYVSSGASKNSMTNKFVIDSWLAITKDISGAIKTKDATSIKARTEAYRANGETNVLTDLDPASIILDENVPPNTKNALWQYVTRLEEVASNPSYVVSNSQQKKHVQEAVANASNSTGKADNKVAETIRNFGPQMTNLVQGFLSGEGEVGKALKEVLDPNKPEGQAAWNAFELVKEKFNDGGAESLLGNLSGETEDTSGIHHYLQRLEDQNEHLLERVSHLEGQIEIIMKMNGVFTPKKTVHKKHNHHHTKQKKHRRRYNDDTDSGSDTEIEEDDIE